MFQKAAEKTRDQKTRHDIDLTFVADPFAKTAVHFDSTSALTNPSGWLIALALA